MTATEIEAHIREAFPDAEMKLVALAADNDHWELTLVSEVFRSKSRVAQHQMVYAALKGHMGGKLHALALKTSSPA